MILEAFDTVRWFAWHRCLMHWPPYSGASPGLLLVLHGTGQLAQTIRDASGLNEIADRTNLLAVYPQAWLRYWRSSGYCNRGLTVFDALYHAERFDASRVFVAGFSGGAYFAHFLAVARCKSITGLVSYAGGLGDVMPRKQPAYRVLVLRNQGDELVKPSESLRLRTAYRDAGHPVEWRAPSGGHRWSREVDDVVEGFLKA